ncbi:MAG: choice-of-anchor J domain-containing protein [Bacteroidales bacterium]|nr:choice-of-anchor J domain-containing protein [Bacteroidales bacterium]
MKKLLLLMTMCILGMIGTANAQKITPEKVSKERNNDETHYPLAAVVATVNEENNVDVIWSWNPIIPEKIVVDFETGNINQANFDNNGNAPWTITNDAYEGNYAIKSTCEGLDNGKSEISITLDVPFDGIMSFYHKVSCEQFFDNGYFYIDGVQKAVATGTADWSYREYKVKKGTHTYKWSYQKDIADSAGDDAYYVDNIVLYQETPPFEGGWIHYDEGDYANAVGSQTGAIYWGISFPDTEEYAGYSLTKVSYFDQDPFNITANIYLGGTDGPGTLVSSQNFSTTGSKNVIEVKLDNPVLLDGTQPLWITFYSTGDFPATGCYHVGDSSSDWISFNGTTWGHTVDYGVIYSWLVRGYLENIDGKNVVLSNVKFNGETSAGPAIAKADAKPFGIGVPERMTSTNKRDFLNIYNVYRKNIHTNEIVKLAENVSDTTFVDTQWNSLSNGAYQWGVGAIYTDNKAESEITWSNTLDFGEMFTSVDMNIMTTGNEVAAGAKVKFTNIDEPGIGYDYKATVDENGSFHWDSFRKGNYSYAVMKKGYDTLYVNNVTIWNETTLEATIDEILAPVENLTVSATGWAKWENRDFSNGGGEFVYNFDDGFLDGWQTIDADGDGFNWRITTDILGPGNGHNGSRYCVISQSFDNDLGGPLTPDNYLVTTDKYLIKDGSQLSFYVCAQDATWSAEHYGIAISTTGNSNPEDFTMIWEETLSSKSGAKESRDGSKQGAWYLKKIDLSNYAEQEIYIAFRHFNCTNQFYVNIDDIVLVNESKNAKAVLSYDVYLDDILEATVTTNYYQHNTEISESHHVTKVVANYATGSSEAVECDWTYSSCENLQGVSNFTAEYFKGKAVLNWNMYGEELPDVIDSFFFDFEDGSIDGWTTIDADGDNYTWRTSAEYMEPGQGNNGSQHYVLSESFNNQFAEVLYPDNYFVTVEKYAIKEDSELSFYVCAQDGEFAAEHYGIAISLAGNTNPNDFTMIWEETLEGDGTRKDRQTKWSLRTIDLSNYAGREIHIAFRHFNCHDQYMLDIDDITLATSKTREEDVLTPVGVLVFRNGELITPEPITENSFAEPFVGEEAVDYCVRVVYNHNVDPETEQPGDINYTGSMSCPQCATVEYVMDCDAPVNIIAETIYYSGAFGVKLTWSLIGEPKHYNIYRSTNDDNYELIDDTKQNIYFDEIDVNGTYHYHVTAVYEKDEEECESDPIHVSILVPVGLNENALSGIMIYPNPTQGALNIEAEGITRITIINTLGQVVYDNNTDSNEEIIDMSQQEAGVYMVKVMTENGLITRRINVVR